MSIAIKKPVQVEFISFTDFVKYAKENSQEPHWSFTYKGHPISHENDECYIVPTDHGSVHFTSDSVLITQISGEIYPCKLDLFNELYNVIAE